MLLYALTLATPASLRMSQTRLCLHVLTRSPQRLPAAFFPVASLRAVTDALHYEDSLFVPRDRQLAKCTLLTGDSSGKVRGLPQTRPPPLPT